MGFLSNLFVSKPRYPALDPGSPANAKLNRVRNSIETLANQVKEPMEIIPAGDDAYIFIGKPPKKFGMAWVEEGKVKNIKILAQEQGLEPTEMTAIQEKLRNAYERHQSEPRFTANVAGRDVVVIPSVGLEQDVKGIISKATH